MAAINNHSANETKRMDIAIQLFEAYSALSCCFISDQLIQEALLPGLTNLLQDMSQLAPDHQEVVQSMVKDFKLKLEAAPAAAMERSDSFSSATQLPGVPGTAAVSPTGGADDGVKSKMMNRIRDLKDKGNTTQGKLSSMFRKK